MKLLPALAMIPAAVAFQVRNQAPPIHYKTHLDKREQKLDRAEECAKVVDYCDVEELETLALGEISMLFYSLHTVIMKI